MGKRPAVIFDLDDTLIQTQILYVRAKEQFHLLMTQTFPGLTESESEELLNAIDIRNTQYGWVKERFPGSMTETYLTLCARYQTDFTAPLLAKTAAIGYQVFSWEAAPMPDAGNVLSQLYLTHDLYLYTMGDPEVQQKRILYFPFRAWFTETAITAHKDVDSLAQFLAFHHVDPATTWYIGDSLKSDIYPAVENGLQAIWLEGNSWSYNHKEIAGEYLTAKELKAIPALISRAKVVV